MKKSDLQENQIIELINGEYFIYRNNQFCSLNKLLDLSQWDDTLICESNLYMSVKTIYEPFDPNKTYILTASDLDSLVSIETRNVYQFSLAENTYDITVNSYAVRPKNILKNGDIVNINDVYHLYCHPYFYRKYGSMNISEYEDDLTNKGSMGLDIQEVYEVFQPNLGLSILENPKNYCMLKWSVKESSFPISKYYKHIEGYTLYMIEI